MTFERFRKRLCRKTCLSIQTKQTLTEGTVPVPPRRPCALRWCRITCLGGYRIRGESQCQGNFKKTRERSGF